MMQLAFQIGDEYLDLLPGTLLELEEENPYLQLDDQIIGPYSFPFDVPHTDKNIRLLGLSSALYSRKVSKIDDVICWENGVQHSVGTLKFEQVQGNINDLGSGTTSLYYLTGSSSFYQEIEGKKLSQVDFGGTRTFLQPSIDYTTGWWKHIDDVMRGGPETYDYAFYPVKNPGMQNDTLTKNAQYLNNIEVVGGVVRTYWGTDNLEVGNPICPFPYLAYVIRQIFSWAGWQVSGECFEDPNFQKITLLSLKDIQWHRPRPVLTFAGLKLYPQVKFDLADHMPTVDIGPFLIAIKNRLGLYYDFSTRTKTCVIRYLKDVISGELEDISSMCAAPYNNKIDVEGKTYRMVNQFDGGDSYPAASDLTGLEILGTGLDLPVGAAIEANRNKLYLVLRENAYYICQEKDDASTDFEWVKYMDNIYNAGPVDASDEITTEATTTLMERVTKSAGNIDGLMPAIKQQGRWWGYNDLEVDFGIRLLFFHGMQPGYTGLPYPYASNHPINSNGDVIGDYSLSYEFQHPTIAAKIGLYDLYWKPFLEKLSQSETITVDVRYPFSKKGQVKFGSPKIINHTKYFVKKKNSVLPYNGVMKLELIKV